MKNTKLMTRLFSEHAEDQEFKEKVADKIAEAKEKGSAELKEGDDDLVLSASEDGSEVIINDQVNDEVTAVKDNPEDEDDILMENRTEVKSDPEEVIQEEVTLESACGERTFSIKLNKVSGKDAAKFMKAFSDAMEEMEKSKDSKEDEEAKAREAAEAAAEEEAKDKMESLAGNMQELQKAYDDMHESGDKEVAKNLKEAAETILKSVDELECDGHDCSVAREKIASFSAEADEIIAKPEETEEEKKAREEAEAKAKAEAEAKAKAEEEAKQKEESEKAEAEAKAKAEAEAKAKEEAEKKAKEEAEAKEKEESQKAFSAALRGQIRPIHNPEKEKMFSEQELEANKGIKNVGLTCKF